MQPAYNVLVVGCGAIGAGYDLHTTAVQTHAKAFHLHPRTSLAVHDRDTSRAREVAEVYGAEAIDELSDDTLARFEIVSICTPTRLHYPLLARLNRLGIPLILCEKPVVGTLEEIEALEALMAGQSRTKILVNYIRRFQPGFAVLRDRLTKALGDEPLRHVVVRYVRGLMNNGGHALDTLNFLLRDALQTLTASCVSSAVYDAFLDDPTVSMQATWHGIPFTFLGFSDTDYSLFEIDIYTHTHHIAIRDSGDTIQYFRAPGQGQRLEEDLTLRQTGVMKDYMVPVSHVALACLEGRALTNFAAALNVNRQLLVITQSLAK